MTNNGPTLEPLGPLAGYFQQYAGRFGDHFQRHLKALHGTLDYPELAAAVNYLYLRHFCPGVEEEAIPHLTAGGAATYQKLLGEREVLSLAGMEMVSDLVRHQAESMTAQMGALQGFVGVAMSETGRLAVQGGKAAVSAEGEGKPHPGQQPRVETEAPEQQPPLENPVELLHRLGTRGTKILCYNLYKGVPISYEARILAVDLSRERVSLQVHRHQATVIRTAGETYIKGRALSRSLHARLLTMDRHRQVVSLGEIAYADLEMEARTQVRVEPKEEMRVQVRHPAGGGEGSVLDLSVGGIGVFMSSDFPAVGAPVQLGIALKGGRVLTLTGTVRGGRTVPGGFQFGVSLLPDTNAELFISQLVVQRQVEVVRELQQLSGDAPAAG